MEKIQAVLELAMCIYTYLMSQTIVLFQCSNNDCVFRKYVHLHLCNVSQTNVFFQYTNDDYVCLESCLDDISANIEYIH